MELFDLKIIALYRGFDPAMDMRQIQNLIDTIYNIQHERKSELPYDPPTVESWQHNGIGGYASCKVADKVKRHEAWGLGIYNIFYKAPIIVNNTIETPLSVEKDIHHKIIFWLNGNKQSLIKNVIYDKGGGVNVDRRKVVME